MGGEKKDRNYRYYLNIIEGDRFLEDSPSGGKIFRWNKVEEAKLNPQCQPAEADIVGNWGGVDLGCRVSVRFAKEAYSTNEPLLATFIIRDVSESETRIFFNSRYVPASVVMVGPKGGALKRKDQEPVNPLASQRFSRRGDEYWLGPQMQRTFVLDLRNLFDISTPGRYVIYSKPMAYDPTSRGFSEIQSGNAIITITKALPKATNSVPPNVPK